MGNIWLFETRWKFYYLDPGLRRFVSFGNSDGIWKEAQPSLRDFVNRLASPCFCESSKVCFSARLVRLWRTIQNSNGTLRCRNLKRWRKIQGCQRNAAADDGKEGYKETRDQVRLSRRLTGRCLGKFDSFQHFERMLRWLSQCKIDLGSVYPDG